MKEENSLRICSQPSSSGVTCCKTDRQRSPKPVPLANCWAITQVSVDKYAPKESREKKVPTSQAAVPKPPIHCSSYLNEGVMWSPVQKGTKGSPGGVTGTSCPRYGQVPLTREGLLPLCISLTFTSSLKGSQAEDRAPKTASFWRLG